MISLIHFIIHSPYLCDLFFKNIFRKCSYQNKKLYVESLYRNYAIWDKDKYEKAIDDATIDFADLAEDVMGNVNDNEDELS